MVHRSLLHEKKIRSEPGANLNLVGAEVLVAVTRLAPYEVKLAPIWSLFVDDYSMGWSSSAMSMGLSTRKPICEHMQLAHADRS